MLSDALALPAAARSAFLDRACSGDAALRREIDSLLAGESTAGESAPGESTPGGAGPAGFLERPAAEALGIAPGPAAGGVPDDLAAALAGRYVLESEAGRGGMGVVYRARDVRLQRPVALKVLRPAFAAGLDAARFRREIKLGAALQHPHVVPVYDAGEANGTLWFAMPFVEGESLRQRLDREGRLPAADAVRMARDVASALDYAHRHGTLHRDVKPANILLTDGHAVVADFGIAKALVAAGETGGDSTAHTGLGAAIGTPAYMAPEQAAADPALDARTDVYALGLVLHEALGGAPAPAAGVPVSPLGDVSAALGEAIARALRPAPDDRYPTAAAFGAALAGALTDDAPARPASRGVAGLWARARRAARPRVAAAAAAVVVASAALAARRVAVAHAAVLDPNRVMVFPLAAAGGALPAGAGEDAATWIGYALEETAPLRWIEAADYGGAASNAKPDGARAAPAAERRLSADQGAGHYVDGTVLRRGDSVTVVLRLHSVRGDSLVAHRAASARVGEISVPDLALRAVGMLLAPLLAPGRRVDVSALENRAPAAIAEFLEAERAYRASHFAEALTHYRAALERDSLFALAALQGAQAASWIESDDDDQEGPLARLAVAHAGSLPPYRAAIARGFAASIAGDADAAVAEFRRAIAFDSTRSEPWMGLGEVYRHLLPNARNLDSLAEYAFVRARRADSAFTPPLYHLAELAIGRGALARADSMTAAFGRAGPDSTALRTLDLSIRCARGTSVPVWARAATENLDAVMRAGIRLSDRPAYAACARAALAATLGAPRGDAGRQWKAAVTLQSLLVALGRDSSIVPFVLSPAGRGVPTNGLLVLDAMAGADVEAGAADVVRSFGDDYSKFPPRRLWLVGVWESERGHGDRVRTIARVLATVADSTHGRLDALLARAIGARAVLIGGDTAEAIRRLRALTPSAPPDVLEKDPSECLGSERLLLARLLFERHQFREARAAAEMLNASHPMSLLLYRRAGLLLRARVARASGTEDPAARAELDALDHAA